MNTFHIGRNINRVINFGSITLTSQGATKTYDGIPLMNNSVTVTSGGGKWNGYINKCLYYCATGTQTEVGSSKNTIEYYWIRPNCIADITIVEGTLTVNALPVTPPIHPGDNNDDSSTTPPVVADQE